MRGGCHEMLHEPSECSVINARPWRFFRRARLEDTCDIVIHRVFRCSRRLHFFPLWFPPKKMLIVEADHVAALLARFGTPEQNDPYWKQYVLCFVFRSRASFATFQSDMEICGDVTCEWHPRTSVSGPDREPRRIAGLLFIGDSVTCTFRAHIT